MKRSLIVNAINILIVVTLVAGLAVLGVILLTGVQTAPSISVGTATSVTSGTVTQIQLPISVTNKGYLSFSNINVQLNVKDSSGDQLLSGTLGPISVAPGQTKQINASLTLDTSKLPTAVVQKLATTSQNLTVTAAVAGGLPPFASVTGTVSAELPWGAPVNNLQVGTPSFAPLNTTAVSVTVPVSFQNQNKYLTLSGTGNIAVFDSNGNQVGGGTVQVNSPPDSSFQKSVGLVVGIPTSQIQSLLFNDQNLTYSAVLTFQSGGQTVFTLTRPITYAWKAPLSGLTVGSPSVAPLNSTNVQLTVPVSFTNENDAFDLSTTVSAAIFNVTSGAQIGSGSLGVNAPHDSSFTGNLVGSIRIPATSITTLAFNDRTFNLRATLSGTYSGVAFSFDRSVTLNWGAPLAGLTIGSPSLTAFSAQGIQVAVPVSFDDQSAWLAVNAPVSVTLVNTTSGSTLGSTTVQVNVPAGQKFSQSVSMTITPSQSTLTTLLYNDETVPLTVKIAGQYAGFNVATQSALSLAWGAPLKGLTLGTPSTKALNSTYFSVSVPVSFTDHSSFLSISTTLSAVLSNATSSAVAGTGSIPVQVSAGGQFSSTLVILAKIPTQYLGTLLFNDETLQYTATLTGSVNGFQASVTRSIPIAWGAPVNNLTFGTFASSAFNSTSAQFAVHFSFSDNSTFLSDSGTISGNVFDTSNNQVGSLSLLTVSAGPGQSSSESLSGYVKLSAASGNTFVFDLVFNTPWGTVTKVVTISA